MINFFHYTIVIVFYQIRLCQFIKKIWILKNYLNLYELLSIKIIE